MGVYQLPEGILDVKEKEAVPKGVYSLRIVDAEPGDSRAGNPKVNVHLEFIDNEDAPNIYHCLNIPYDGCNEYISLLFVRFCKLFDIPPLEFDPESLIGMEVERCKVKYVPEDEDNDHPPRNELVLPRLKK